MTVLLEMQGISKTFPGVRALDDVTLEVRQGEIHAVCGENGAGKSTLMKVLSGVYPHGTYEGTIRYAGHEARDHAPARLRAPRRACRPTKPPLLSGCQRHRQPQPSPCVTDDCSVLRLGPPPRHAWKTQDRHAIEGG